MEPEYKVGPAGVTVTAVAELRLTRARLEELIREIDAERRLHEPAAAD